MILNLEIN